MCLTVLCYGRSFERIPGWMSEAKSYIGKEFDIKLDDDLGIN